MADPTQHVERYGSILADLLTHPTDQYGMPVGWEQRVVVMHIRSDGQGRDFATCGQHRASSCAELAKLLVDAGFPDGAWHSVTRAGTISMYGPSLHRLAGSARAMPGAPLPADAGEPVAGAAP